MLTNCHEATGDFTVDHWSPARRGEVAQTSSGKILKQISICPSVHWYRKWMGAVDRFDQFRAYIKLEMSTGKFWHVMLWFIIESALVNAYILYKTTRECALLDLEYSHLEFCIAVVLALVSEWESMGCTSAACSSKWCSECAAPCAFQTASLNTTHQRRQQQRMLGRNLLFSDLCI
jgi:hypothetical protein